MRQTRMFKNVEYDEQFKRFQAAYPKRSPTMRWAECYTIWQQAVKAGVSVDEMIAGATRYARYCTRENMVNTPYVMLPLTFIIEREFENDFMTEVEAQESSWECAVRLAKERGLPPFKGFPHETAEGFIKRVESACGKVVNIR